MPSTFLALQIGLSGLQIGTLGTETAGNNIANASTPGYARETVDAETETSLHQYTDHSTYLGQGVNPRGQKRVDDVYVDAQYRDNNAQQSYWQTQDTELGNIGQIFNEPTGSTLRQEIDNFFSAWNGLTQNPADSGARAQVLEAGKALSDAFNTTANAIQQAQTRYANEMVTQVKQINSIAQNIANLNSQIEKAQASGDAPNNLLDQRDALLNQLSSLVSFQVTYTPDANNSNVVHMQINLDQTPAGTIAQPLVSDGTVNALTDPSTANPPDYSQIAGLTSSGTLKSTYDLYVYAQNVGAQIDNLANSIATDVNQQQNAGADLTGAAGAPFFNGNTAATLQLALANGSQIAAAASGQPANSTDGSNAQAMAGLLQSQGYDATYNGIVTQIGTDGQAAHQQLKTFQALTTQAQGLQQSVSGVNINEEMAAMIQYQQTYGAAAKFISTFNDMLNTLIQSV